MDNSIKNLWAYIKEIFRCSKATIRGSEEDETFEIDGVVISSTDPTKYEVEPSGKIVAILTKIHKYESDCYDLSLPYQLNPLEWNKTQKALASFLTHLEEKETSPIFLAVSAAIDRNIFTTDRFHFERCGIGDQFIKIRVKTAQ